MAETDPSSQPDFEALFNACPACCLVLSPELRIVAVSDPYLQATMTQRKSILGRPLFEVFPDDPNDPQADGTRKLRASLDRVIASRAPDTMAVQRYAIRRPDGSFETRFWAPSNHPVLGASGALRWIIHMVSDVTRQQSAEAAAQAIALGPASAMAAFFDGIFEGVQVVDFEGRYVYLNSVAAEHGRRGREELLGKRMADEYPGIEKTEFYGLLERCLRQRSSQQFTNHFSYPDGSKAWFELRIEPVPLGAMILSQDISEKVRLEEGLKASARMEAVGRLAGGIAHDFNNLITVISGYAALLRESLPADDERREDLEQIQSAGDQAADLTRQLLAFSRKQVLQPKVLDLNRTLEGVAKLLRRVIGENIDLVLRPQAGLDRVCVDPGQLEQIIMNLALNARDAMPQGGQLTLETANAVLDESYCQAHPEAQAGPHVLLAVSDSGHGMDDETLGRIFEPFFTTKSKGRGTGLGLATVHGIVKQSGGNIWVYSEPGRGSTFKVYLPSSGATALEPPVAEGTAPPAPAGNALILLVEDEAGVRKLFESVLKTGGYQVLSAASGEEALEVSERHTGSIELLLTDVVLPGMGGKELAVKLLAQRPALKVVYMSGYTDNAIVHQGVLDAGTAFISKPVSPSVLLQKIRAYLAA